MPIDNTPPAERNVSGINTQTHKTTNEQEDKPINDQMDLPAKAQDNKSTRKIPNKKGNVQETFYCTPKKKKKIALLATMLDMSKSDLLDEGVDYLLDKYKNLLKRI